MSAATIQHPETSQHDRGASPESTSIALRATEGEGQAEYIALRALRLDERNVRRDEPADQEIDELADLIDAQGLLQNLSVVAYAEPVRGRGKERKALYTHGVIAGGRRLRALQRLVKRGRLTLDEQILCTVFPADRALTVSTAENSGRTPMSAADTIVAFAEMVKAGAGIEELAACFHLSPLMVQRRLKLASVAPQFFAMFRTDALSLDQLMALALTDDHAKQQAAWDAAPRHDRSARTLRALLLGDGVSPAIERFVGLEVYEAAGGSLVRDLFTDDGAGAHVLDPGLMMQLATAKLERLAAELRDQGLPWVEAFLRLGHEDRQRFTRAPTAQREATADEATALAKLEAEANPLNDRLNALYDVDEDEAGQDHQEQIQAVEDALQAITDQVELIQTARRVVLPEYAGIAGAVVHVDPNSGDVCVERNLVRKVDAAGVARALAKQQAASDAGPEAHHQDPKAGLSERLCHQLTAHRTRALQALMLTNQRASLASLLHPLVARLVHGLAAAWEAPSAIKVKAEDCESALATSAPDLTASRADQLVRCALAEARSLLPESPADLQAWLLAQDMATLLQLATLCAALALNAIDGTGKQATTVVLANVLGLHMADWWEATEASYLGAVPKSLIVDAVKEAGMAEDAGALSKLKKGEAVTKAQELLAGKRWLPAVLR